MNGTMKQRRSPQRSKSKLASGSPNPLHKRVGEPDQVRSCDGVVHTRGDLSKSKEVNVWQ